MKDVVTCDKPRGAGKQASIRGSPNRETLKYQSHVWQPPPEHIGRLEGTWGSETSQYPQEEKTTVIPSVVASERGTGQTYVV